MWQGNTEPDGGASDALPSNKRLAKAHPARLRQLTAFNQTSRQRGQDLLDAGSLDVQDHEPRFKKFTEFLCAHELWFQSLGDLTHHNRPMPHRNLRPPPKLRSPITRGALLFGVTSLVACQAQSISTSLTADDLVRPTAPPPEPIPLPKGLHIRAGTWNLHGGTDGPVEAIGAALAAMDLDVVGLQECPEDLAIAVAEHSGFSHYAWRQGRALLANAPLLNPSHHAFAAGRAVLHANLEHEGVTFSVYDAHIGWNAEGDLQARELSDTLLATDPNPYLIMVGDFNDEHYSSQITIIEEHLQEALLTAGLFPERISWPAADFDGSEGSQLIDLVFFSTKLNPIVVEAEVVNLAPILSDHKPTWAELIFPSAGAPALGPDPFAAQRDPSAGFPAESERPSNLLINPGAEDGLQGWQAVGGFVAAAERDQQSPRSGQALFTGYARPDRRPDAYADQRIDLSEEAEAIDEGRAQLLIEAYMATGYDIRTSSNALSNSPRPYDDAELTVTLEDAQQQPLGVLSSGRRGTLKWHAFRDRLALPPGTRSAQVRLHSHHKGGAGISNDAVFDDLYVGLSITPTSHVRLGADLVHNGGSESVVDKAWSGQGWQRHEDQQALGIMAYPPWTASGHWCWATARSADGSEGTVTLSQDLDISAFERTQDEGRLGLRWGGWLRTLNARGQVKLQLQVLDRDGSVFATLSSPAQRFAEWSEVQALTWIPPGASGLRLTLQGELDEAGAALFADGIYAWPERLPEASP